MTETIQSPILQAAEAERAALQAKTREACSNVQVALDAAAEVARNLESVEIPAARAALRDGRGSWLTLAKLNARLELARDFRKEQESLLRGIGGGLETPDLDIKIQTLRADLNKYRHAKGRALAGLDTVANLKTMRSLAVKLGLSEHFARFRNEIQTESAA